MTAKYDSKDVQVLDEISHIRLNPSMYIGDTSTPTHLVEEALDNALDECMAKHATIIAVNIDTKNNICSVIDNGRGIPISNDTPKIISTKLFSGAKFQTTKTAYEICCGLHGVGLVALNALSKVYTIEVYRNNQYAIFEFEDSKFKKKSIKKFDEEKPFSTKIQFQPDKQIFESIQIDLDRIRRRLIIASAEIPNVTFVLNVDDTREIFELDRNQYFTEHCILSNDTDKTETISLSSVNGPEKFDVIFCYSLQGIITPKISTSVNLLPVESGGIHVNYFLDILKEVFTNRAKKASIKFQQQDCLCGLRAYLSLYLKTPEFHGQTKDKLVNRRSYLDKLAKKIRQDIEDVFNNNNELLEKLLTHFEQYRKKLDSRKLSNTNGQKRASTKFTKLRDCINKNGELFVIEGDSAAGSFIQSRDHRKHAILPLKGKIPSIVNAKDILKNKEIGELIQAMGTGVGPHFDINNLKYDKIICATDADSDGYHIFCLLTMAIAILVPEIIKQGHYYFAMTPLYAINEKKTFIPLWTKQKLEEARQQNKSISRFKGLGELSPWQVKLCAFEEQTRKLIQVQYTSDIEKMLSLFSDVSAKRVLLDDESVLPGEDILEI